MSEPIRLRDLKPTHPYVGGFSAGRFEKGLGWRIWSVAEQRTIAYVESRDEQIAVVWALNHKPATFDETCGKCRVRMVVNDEAWCRVCQAENPTTFDEEGE